MSLSNVPAQIDASPFVKTFAILNTFETVLNMCGYIPLVGSASAVLRAYYAKIEVIAGVALAIFALTKGDAASQNFYFSVAITFIGHAILNGLRSMVEIIPTVPLFTCLPYDIFAAAVLGKRLFSYS